MHRLIFVVLTVAACGGANSKSDGKQRLDGVSSSVDDTGEVPSWPVPPAYETYRIEASELGIVSSGEDGFVGPGIAVADFSGDDSLDVAWVSPRGFGVMLQNDGTGSLFPVSSIPAGTGCAAVDIDADGDMDLVIVGLYGDWLLTNQGDGTFAEALIEPELFPVASSGASFADVDQDGDLDLFIATYLRSLVLSRVESGDLRGEHSRLYENVDGRLVPWQGTLSAAAQEGLSFHGPFFDPNGGVEPWLYLVNDFGGMVEPNLLLRWDGSRFVDAGAGTGADVALFGMGAGVGDTNHDGLPDLFLTNLSRSRFLRNLGGGQFADAGLAEGLVVEGPACDTSWSAVFSDVDLDGWMDLAVTCGQLMPEDDPHREDFLGLSVDQGHPVDPAEQPDRLFLNQHGAGWLDTGATVGFDYAGPTKTVVVGDMNRDGRPDLITAGGEYVAVHLSQVPAQGVTIRLADPRSPNRHGVGARLTATAGDLTQVAWMLPYSQGSHSSGAAEIVFGLGEGATLDQLDVVWPDGTTSSHGPFSAGDIQTVSP